MNEEWLTFLTSAGAETDGNHILHYGNPSRELSVALTGGVFADLSHYGLISAHGKDAEDFLLAQFTNDLRLVSDSLSQLSGYCNPKGRLLASMRIFRRSDTWYLILPENMIQTILKRLRMYVMRADVTLDEASDSYMHLGASGDGVGEAIRDTLGILPDTVNAVSQTGDTTVIRISGPHPRYEIFTGFDQAKQLWDALNVDSAPIAVNAWSLLDIEAGVPVIIPQTTETFVPQMVNLQLVDGVSFKKGCYPGQEIVARMQYLGKLKKRMYKATTPTSAELLAGMDIFQKGGKQPVGKIVNLAPHPDGGYNLLAVLQRKSAEDSQTQLYVDGHNTDYLTLSELPYPWPAEE